jgi:tyrosinase
MAKKKAGAKPAAKLRAVGKPLKQPSKIYVSPKIPLDSLLKDFHRADLVFEGLDHSGATFEARVFVNNKAATATTATTAQKGYAGTFHIFGHGGCFGDAGHCEVRGLPRPYDPRPAHPLTPARKVVIATEAIRRAIKGKDMTVTVVPIVRAGTEECDYKDVLKFEKLSVRTYL